MRRGHSNLRALYSLEWLIKKMLRIEYNLFITRHIKILYNLHMLMIKKKIHRRTVVSRNDSLLQLLM